MMLSDVGGINSPSRAQLISSLCSQMPILVDPTQNGTKVVDLGIRFDPCACHCQECCEEREESQHSSCARLLLPCRSS